MLRTLGLLSITGLLSVPAGGIATAQPAPGSCSYAVSAPTVVTISGTDVVTATLSTGACEGAVTFETVACIQMSGSSGSGQCAQGRGILPAQVFFQPYRPGMAYTATGRGCASAGNPPRSSCQQAAPVTATL